MRDKIALEMHKVFYEEVWRHFDSAEYLGMDSRDYNPVKHWPEVVAKRAYAYADAMLEARNIPEPPGDE